MYDLGYQKIKQGSELKNQADFIYCQAREHSLLTLRRNSLNSALGGGESQCQKGVATGHHDDHAH